MRKKIIERSWFYESAIKSSKHDFIFRSSWNAREIDGSKDGKTVGIIPALLNGNFPLSDYFIETSYKDASGKSNKAYDITKMRCELIGNKQQMKYLKWLISTNSRTVKWKCCFSHWLMKWNRIYFSFRTNMMNRFIQKQYEGNFKWKLSSKKWLNTSVIVQIQK